ncbi:MAG: hypothetical protein ACTSWX_11820 [Promethearchaeota archaeon]
MVIKISSKRLNSLDVIRGSMIFYVIFLHALIQRVFVSQGSEFEKVVDNIPLIFTIVGFPLILFSLWGTIFTFISGIATGYNVGSGVFKNQDSLNSHLKKRVANSLMLLIISKISMFFFSGRTSDHFRETHSLFTGSLETGTLSIPEFLHLFTINTLESMAISGLLLSLIFYLMWKNEKPRPKQAARNLIILAIGVFFITHYLRSILSDSEVMIIKESLWNEHSYLKYYLFLAIYASRFAMFPVLAFALVGAAFGVLIAGKVRFKEIFAWIFISGTLFIAAFIIGYLQGFDMIGTFANELVLLPMQCLNIGLQIYLFGICYYFFDVKQLRQRQSEDLEEKNKAKVKTNRILKFLRKYSDLSLTIYILEPLIAQSWYLLYYNLHKGSFSTNFPLIMLYLATVVATWFLMIWVWKKINNKYSFEWLMGKGKKVIMNIMNIMNIYWWKRAFNHKVRTPALLSSHSSIARGL